MANPCNIDCALYHGVAVPVPTDPGCCDGVQRTYGKETVGMSIFAAIFALCAFGNLLIGVYTKEVNVTLTAAIYMLFAILNVLTDILKEVKR